MRTPLALTLGFASLVVAVAACESSDSGGASGNIAFDSGAFDGSGGPRADGGVDEAGDDGGEAGADGSVGVTTFHVALSGSGSCAVFEDGRMKCWGQPNLLSGAPPVGVAAGQMGAALPYVSTPAPVKKIVATSDGGFCAVFIDGTMRCWATQYLGQSTAGNAFMDIKTNIDLGAGRKVVDVAAATSHTCAILDDGKVKCWGNNANGHLGNGSTTDAPLPPVDEIDLGTGRTAKALTASFFFTCALLDDDRVKCWGYGAGGHLANGSEADVGSMPNQMGDNLAYAKLGTDPNTGAPWKVKTVMASGEYACALLANDRIKCWGPADIEGVLGNGSTSVGYGSALVDDAIPFVDVGTDPNTAKPWTVTAMAVSDVFVCATIAKNGGSVVCWGADDAFGDLGLGTQNNRIGDVPGEMGDNLVAVKMKPGRVPTTLYISYANVCARVDAAILDCWGSNHAGALGVGLPDTASSSNLGDDPAELGANFAETFLR